jgi:nucleoside phosphorylase
MAVDLQWASRNLGVADADGLVATAAAAPAQEPDRAIRRELIEFDSEGPEGKAFQAVAPRTSTGLSKFVDIRWPQGLAPTPGARPTGESLPPGDALVVTWTVDEGHALSRVLSPGFDSQSDWQPYTKNFDQIAQKMRADSPAREAGNLGTYWTTEIGSKRAILFKSNSHMSQDGPDLPVALVWKQIIEDVQPQWVITTGTGGGIGPDFEVGDVIVSRFVSFDCKKEFQRLNGESFACATNAPEAGFREAQSLFSFNAGSLPPDNKRAPQIVIPSSPQTGILTTDFFGFDNTADTYQLEGKGDLSEMGDAVLGMVCQQMGSDAPSYTIVRNVSDPQIDSSGMTLEQQTQLAATIYKGFGRWSSVCSAIVCWSIVASLAGTERSAVAAKAELTAP